MRIVVALGGNALLRRGEALSFENQRANVRIAAKRIAQIIPGNEVLIVHGNGPQVGLLALQAMAYTDVSPYPLDVLGAETEAMIGYMIEQELGNEIDADHHIATLLTMTEVDAQDPAFNNPTKPIGPVYDQTQADALAETKGWDMAPDGDKFRRVVASPRPKRIFEIDVIRKLMENDVTVICGGGGGIPTMYDADGHLRGVEAVVDKDLSAALIARELDADMLVIATDVDGVYTNFGTPDAAKVETATVAQLQAQEFAKGSMGPKVEAACEFAERTQHTAVIGSLSDIADIVAGKAGTRVTA